MPRDSWSVYHSLLSPYMNVGLLHASEVIEAVRVRFQQGGVSLASCEGFVRQVIGWREYINGIYWFFNDSYRESNGLAANRKLLPLYWNPQATEMNCARSVVEDLRERSWVHHIPRLMVLSNLALLTAVNPQEYLDWMRQTFIDASEWVMVPNVIGMGVHADNGQMMTKPYAAGGAYVNRMSNYCGGCRFDPKKRTGEDACPLTTLYWDFLDRNREGFARNHRIAQQVKGLDRLSDLPEVQARAREVLAKLEAGEL
jgi:deoxyribodipyrimidine photolyase-related protein